MAKLREVYICSSCNGQCSIWKGQCPHCGGWNTLAASSINSQTRSRATRGASGAAAQPFGLSVLSEAEGLSASGFSAGNPSIDRVLGGGLNPGAAILIGGEPGIGKSTLLLQIAGAVAAGGRKTIYLSGEETLNQLKSRAERLNVLHDNLLALATTQVEDIFPALEGPEPPALLIADSVQTLSSPNAEGLAGNVAQVKAVAADLVEICKRKDITLILVGHVTKEGALAGPKLLEHMVDTVIALEGDREHMFRLMRILKNRFGPNQELLVFQMIGQGMELVEDPSTYFLGARDAGLSGAAVALTVDGQRPFAVEVQALAGKSYLAIPRRASLGLDVNRLHLVLAVLEKRLRLSFAQLDLYIKISGGMHPQDPGLDLALVAAILSSFYDVPLPERAVFWGEVDLNGQVRPVSAHSIRLDQAKRLGYSPVLHPRLEGGKGGIRNLNELNEALFSKKRG